jgi:putative hemolysin
MVELLIILLLLVLNGVFAMTEIAILSASRAKLRQLADPTEPDPKTKALPLPNKGAQAALRLVGDTEHFLSSVQVVLTLLGTLASVFGGASLAAMVRPWLEAIPSVQPYAENLSFALVVGTITYLSVIIGELVPKNLALRFPLTIACAMARPMEFLAKATSPLVRVLKFNTNLIMRLFGSSPSTRVTSEDMNVLVKEGIITGGIEVEQGQLLQSVLELESFVAEEVMRPKPKMVFLRINDNLDQVVEAIAKAPLQTVFPVHEGASRDEIVGMISLRVLLTLQEAMDSEPTFVPENEPVISLLESLPRSRLGAALVTDEFGTVRGMVAMDDIAEEVFGRLVPLTKGPPGITSLGDNEWSIDGMAEIDDISTVIPEMELAARMEDEPFQSLGGYLHHKLDRQPMKGDTFVVEGLQFEVTEMNRQRVQKVRIRRVAPSRSIDSAEGL